MDSKADVIGEIMWEFKVEGGMICCHERHLVFIRGLGEAGASYPPPVHFESLFGDTESLYPITSHCIQIRQDPLT